MKIIKSIEVRNSPFYENFSVAFSQKLNCIMGGRGAGKSTLLFFIKACLTENIEQDERLHKLLTNNLGFGEVVLKIHNTDTGSYTIRKILNEAPQITFDPTNEHVDLVDIFDRIEVDFYETSKIELIGMNSRERLLLIDKRNKAEIGELQNAIQSIQNDLFTNGQTIIHITKQIDFVNEQLKQYSSAKEEFERHKALQPEGVTDEEKKEFETADINQKKRDNERRFINKNIEVFNEVLKRLRTSFEELTEYERKLKSIEFEKTFYNEALAKRIFDDTNVSIRDIKDKFSSVEQIITSLFPKYNTASDELRRFHLEQEGEFVKLKAKYEKRRAYFDTFNLLSKKVSKSDELKTNLTDLEKKLKTIERDRDGLIGSLNEKKLEVFKIRQSVVLQLNEIFDGDIKITLTSGGIKEEFEAKLRKALTGAGRYYAELIPKIVEQFSPDKFAKAINEADLSALKTVDGIDEQRASTLALLKGKQELFDIEALYCPDLPIFYLKVVDDGDQQSSYKRSEELSMGQRCTTVLPIVFSVSSNPLIVDQPEDNLDNKYIADRIHAIIRSQKDARQIIFVTHNPNIPVLADSEFNLFLKFERKAGIEKAGAIDEVKDNIIYLLEGGKKAFVTRKEKYNL